MALSMQDVRLAVQSHFKQARLNQPTGGANHTGCVSLEICELAGITDEVDALKVYDLIDKFGGPDAFDQWVVVYQSPNWKE